MYFVEVSGELLKKGTIGVCKGCGASLFKLVKDVNINSVKFEDVWDIKRNEEASFGFDKCKNCSNSPEIMYVEELNDKKETTAEGFCRMIKDVMGTGIVIDEAAAMNSQLKKTIVDKQSKTKQEPSHNHIYEIGYDRRYTDAKTAIGYVVSTAKTKNPVDIKDVLAIMRAYDLYRAEKEKFEKGL